MIRFKGLRGENMDRAVNTLLEELAQDPEAQLAEESRQAPPRKRKTSKSTTKESAEAADTVFG